ncbi:uncharacterized protein LOC132194389 [Neocloeon triangulifer]|uniref:uncharacterized protein LOC132194389 n=1 Tax=Neocloeon triangulifer TaxID=2078957 RepID=UPI00286F3E28|nr:uncharacterized protein LOC132194389 [Neocloeon triangulifer]
MDNFEFKFVSAMQMEKVIEQVRQARQDKEDDLRLQFMQLKLDSPKSNLKKTDPSFGQTLATTYESDQSSEELSSSDNQSTYSTSSNSSDSASDSEEKQSDKVVSVKSKSTKGSVAPVQPEKPKFDHHQTVLAIKKSQAALKSVLRALLEKSLKGSDAENAELGSPRAEEKRRVKLAEFRARMRRNYIYTLKIEVDKLNPLIQRMSTNIARNTAKQSAFRMLSRALSIANQGLQTYMNQTALRRDFLATLTLLESFLELASQLDDALRCLEVEDDELIHLRLQVAESVKLAHSEEFEFATATQATSMKNRRGAPKNLVPRKMKKTAPKGKKNIVQREVQPSLTPLQSVLRDEGTMTEKYAPLVDVVSQMKTMTSKPVNVRFLVAKHDGVSNTETQTGEDALQREAETQTADFAVQLEDSHNCRIEGLIADVLKTGVAEDSDYLAEIIEEVIRQEFL